MNLRLLGKTVSRRRFVQLAMAVSLGMALAACRDQGTAAQRDEASRDVPLPQPGQAYLSVARGEEPAEITRAALAAWGGVERFVKSGYDVIVKSNICVDCRSYEYGVTINPEVVGTLVGLCLGAGAKRVQVMDFPLGGGPESAYSMSGIAEAVRGAGGKELTGRSFDARFGSCRLGSAHS